MELRTQPDGLLDADSYNTLAQALRELHTEDLVNLIGYTLTNRDDIGSYTRDDRTVGEFLVPGNRAEGRTEENRIFRVEVKHTVI
jgi:hypothetical protein